MEPLVPGARRASHIVVFRQPAGPHAALLAEALGGVAASLRLTGTTEVLTPLDARRGPVRLFGRLGVASADLTGEQAERLAGERAILAVLPNELRTLPPFEVVAAIDPPPGTSSGSGGAGGAREERSGRAGGRARRLLAELLALLGRRRGADPAEGTVAAPPTPPPASWCLDLLGVSPHSPRRGRGARVAVLDTGIDLGHRDFARHDFHALASFVPGEPVDDLHGHGTHCAGVVAGPLRSVGPWRYGVAPEAELLIGKVLGAEGSGYDEWIFSGIDWAVDQGAHVVSLSLGKPRAAGGGYSLAYEQIASRLLAEDPGVLVVAAAGNDSRRPLYTAPVGNPAACPSVLAVAAADEHRRIAPFSCCEMDAVGQVDLTAPGVAVHSAWRGGGFRSLSGTSMATPHVAGVAALHLEARPQRARDLWVTLAAGARPVAPRSDFGAGIAQAP